jgi:hypothetical protein
LFTMSGMQSPDSSPLAEPARAKPSPLKPLERASLWVLGGALWSLAVGWLALQVQRSGVSPAMLAPLAVGGFAGAGGVGLAAVLRPRPGRWLLIAAAAWGLLAVLGQDYSDYLAYRRDYEETRSRNPLWGLAQAANENLGPAKFPAFMFARVRDQPLWWPLDLALTELASCAVVGWGLNRVAQLRAA